MPPTSPVSLSSPAPAFFQESPRADSENLSASKPTRLDADEMLWRRLKLGKNPVVPDRFSPEKVAVNHSGVRCLNNEHTIKIGARDDGEIPIHANSVAQFSSSELPYIRANLTYAAGQSPTEHNYKNMLIQGIESGLGTFQLVSTRAHRHERDSKETPLITLLKAGWTDRSQPFDLSDRYQVTDLKKITGDYNKPDDHVRYEMTIRETQNPDKIITIPLTQAALPFTDRVLHPDKIKRAHELMQAHCDACEAYANKDKRALAWKNLMVLSHAGYGRNATVITYCRIAALAVQGATAVTEHNLCEHLEGAIRTGMKSRDPNFVHSQPQMSALRKALENWFGEKKVAARAVPRDDGAQRRRLNTHVHAEDAITPPAATAEVQAAESEPALSATADLSRAVTFIATPFTATPLTATPLTATPLTATPRPATSSTAAASTAASQTLPTSVLPTALTNAAPTVVADQVSRTEDIRQHLQSLTGQRLKVGMFFGGLLSFKGRLNQQVTIETILKDDNFDLEEEHQFIQRLFPIDTRSEQQKNVNEPVLDGEDFVALRGNTIISNGLDEAFNKMLEFFGLKWEGKNIVVHDLEQARKCFTPLPLNHNNLRATRMIRSMALFGKIAKAKALHTFLKDFCAHHFENHTSLVHWEEAFNKPVVMNKAGTEQPDYPGLLFPNKSLMGDKEEPPLGTIKKALFDKQQQFYEAASLQAQDVAAPLVARFTKSTLSISYAANKHLEEQFNPPNTCNISSHPGLYFCSDAQESAQSLQHPPYEVHVDFANKKLGGTWVHDGSFAQEEVAFIENIGLGRVADQERRTMRKEHPLPEPLPNESEIAYPTRLDNDVPSPIIIEGCERVAHLNAYGKEAAWLGNKIVQSPIFSAVTPPKHSNWLAIAARSYASVPVLQNKNVEECDNAWMNRVSEGGRITAFNDLFRTAHAGFSMAKKLAGDRPLILHTGQLGCGIFKNSQTLSIAAQLLAAKVVGVDNLHFYDTKLIDTKFKRVQKIVSECTQGFERKKTVQDLVTNVLKKLFAATNTGAAS